MSDKLQARVVPVTPRMARRMLDTRAPNRHLSKRMVARHVAAMKRGEWHLSGQAIQFNGDGSLVDGQHRLAAVVESGMTIPMLVVKGLSSAAVDIIDTGRRRTVGDVLAMRGCKYANITATAIRLLIMYREKSIGTNFQSEAVSTPQVVKAWSKNRAMEDYAQESRLAWGIVAPGPYTFARFITAEVNQGASDEFFFGFYTGENLPRSSPILSVRNRFINANKDTRAARKGQVESAAILVKAFNAHRAGKALGPYDMRFFAGKEGFPVPK